MRNALLAALVALPFLFSAGCKAKGNPEACKTAAKDGDGCKKCCNQAGVSGYMWNGMSNDCKCM